jgi:Fe(II)/alpha-ketoglutarate-dependent arginine beta-hydroxylase
MKLTLDENENREILELTGCLAARFGSAEHPDFLAQAAVHAHRLPLRMRLALHELRLFEPAAAICRVQGYAVDERAIGPTPAHWKDRQRRCVPVKEEILLILMGSLLGDPIGWSTQQNGALVHDIAPIKGHESEQLGSGSGEELTWHTEDAFHPYRGDYLGMMCMRNPDRIPTTFAAIDISSLDAAARDLLFQPLYTIRPDNSHLPKNRLDAVVSSALASAYEQIGEMGARPEKIAVFLGAAEAPYCRLDPYFMDPPEDPAARAALDRLIRLVDSRLEDIVLEPGELCFIDNFRAVHGRRSFRARFDGTDRWLKRINVTRDLRRSRTARATPQSRVLF